jgi:gas vesicle protein
LVGFLVGELVGFLVGALVGFMVGALVATVSEREMRATTSVKREKAVIFMFVLECIDGEKVVDVSMELAMEK